MRVAFICALFSAFLPAFFSCMKFESYPDTPQVDFARFVSVDTQQTLSGTRVANLSFEINFTDGDGDFGLPISDTTGAFHSDSAHYFNLYTTVLSKKQGVYTPELEYNYRISDEIIPTGQNKTQKGLIAVKYNSLLVFWDSIAIAFYIEDQALHQSNVDTSLVIRLR
jgi:hypothetical protein